MAKLKILDDIERLADGYLVLNVLSNIAFNIVGIYAAGYIVKQTIRMLGGC